MNLGPLAFGLGAIVVASLLRARAVVDQTESGGWYRDGTSPATTCVRCGRRLKRPGVRLVSTDDPTVIVAAGPSCARKLADGAVCERCEQGDLLPELPGERPECCTKPYKEWSATGAASHMPRRPMRSMSAATDAAADAVADPFAPSPSSTRAGLSSSSSEVPF